MPKDRSKRFAAPLRRATLSLACVLVAIAPAPAGAGAWVRQPGSVFLKIAGSYLKTDTEFDHRGDEVDVLAFDDAFSDATYRDMNLSAYGEYGVNERLTLVGAVAYKVLTSRHTESTQFGTLLIRRKITNGGFADLSAAARYAILTEPLMLSVEGGVKIPMGYDRTPENLGAPLGSGRFDAQAVIQAGKSLWPLPGYVTGGFGYRAKGGDLDDELLYSFEAGASFDRLSAWVVLDGLASTSDPPDLADMDDDGASATTRVVNQNVTKLITGIAVTIQGPYSASAEIFHTLAGKNTVRATTAAIALVYKR